MILVNSNISVVTSCVSIDKPGNEGQISRSVLVKGYGCRRYLRSLSCWNLNPHPPSRVVGALERDVRGKETRLSGRIGAVAAGGGRGALFMEGPEAAGNARWPIWHELGRRLIGWRVRMMSEACRLSTTPSGREWRDGSPERPTA